ncbi:hypothetical protein MPSYJ_50050 [Mycolicibacterium psychrotolerans]|uniref:SGNH domain-containing protein n=1 Tax=Mycolicibacterium psychrotolerans TaxID=216929 RepID=A0A7I7MGS6_9MYCO|nr:hypothetical protein MPSYJ_50050 [Mycolicibacterium psychrotolerans]
MINQTKPAVVFIADSYAQKHLIGGDQDLTTGEWATGMQTIVEKFRRSAEKVVWLSAPPPDKNIAECYGKRSSAPADCISEVQNYWIDMAQAEQDVAAAVEGVWVDSRPWFCKDALCPAFVGSTPTKRDTAHLTRAYGEKITPVIAETLRNAGVLPATG